MPLLSNIMIDMESMGTIADAPILSIGAVRFDPHSGALGDTGFYRSITLESNFDYGRRPSENTIKWWMNQTESARAVFTEAKVGLDTALEEFIDWVYDHETSIPKRQRIQKDQMMWSNGADFDLPMLAHAITYARHPVPWNFWNSRCVRTYKNLPGARDITVERVGTHHNALGDAITQAQLVQKINATLFPPYKNGFGAVKKVA